jgi:hypothetical protein
VLRARGPTLAGGVTLFVTRTIDGYSWLAGVEVVYVRRGVYRPTWSVRNVYDQEHEQGKCELYYEVIVVIMGRLRALTE